MSCGCLSQQPITESTSHQEVQIIYTYMEGLLCTPHLLYTTVCVLQIKGIVGVYLQRMEKSSRDMRVPAIWVRQTPQVLRPTISSLMRFLAVSASASVSRKPVLHAKCPVIRRIWSLWLHILDIPSAWVGHPPSPRRSERHEGRPAVVH